MELEFLEQRTVKERASQSDLQLCPLEPFTEYLSAYRCDCELNKKIPYQNMCSAGKRVPRGRLWQLP